MTPAHVSQLILYTYLLLDLYTGYYQILNIIDIRSRETRPNKIIAFSQNLKILSTVSKTTRIMRKNTEL